MKKILHVGGIGLFTFIALAVLLLRQDKQTIPQDAGITGEENTKRSITSEDVSVANWKTYAKNGISFVYPTRLTVLQTADDYYLLSQSDSPAQGDVVIDARLLQTASDFQSIIDQTKKDLQQVQEVQIGSGIILVGTFSSQTYGEKKVAKALIPYESKAIILEHAYYTLNDDEFVQLVKSVTIEK